MEALLTANCQFLPRHCQFRVDHELTRFIHYLNRSGPVGRPLAACVVTVAVTRRDWTRGQLLAAAAALPLFTDAAVVWHGRKRTQLLH